MSGKKIGVVLALDGERAFSQSAQNARKESANLKSELKKLTTEYDGNANSQEFLMKKQENLIRQTETYTNTLKNAKAGLENAQNVQKRAAQRYEELKKSLEEARKEQEKLISAGKDGSKECKEQEKKVSALEQAVEKQGLQCQKCEGKVSDWSRRVNDAENNLEKTDRELKKNATYLKEAENATDKCATSINEFGKEAQGATKTISGWGEKLASAATAKGVSMAVDAMGQLKDKAVETAKYVVEVGSAFEAAMSEVQAISGASGSDLDAMTEKAKELGASTKFSASEVAEGFKYMSLAGWSTSSMLSGIDGVLNLAAASGMELAEASDMVTDYLSAFGLQASDSAKMADMLAYAQANSNTSAKQLGDAYGNCAAILHSGGQDIETVTSLLEGMANQGLKGSEAGTALSSIMTQITQKMKDGKIAIGDTAVQVADSNGNFRDMTDIITDVDAALEGMGTQERSAALAATFNKTALSGLNLILNEGIGNISNYETALRSSSGAAEEMSEIMNDNLKGDLTEAKSALEGLGIAAYDYVDGSVRGVVQGVTGVIQGITEAITPQKTELETFIEDVKASNEEVNKLIQNAQDTVNGANADVTNLEAYKQVLMELNEQESLTEFQKYQLKNAVETLGNSVPGLTEAFDSETGTLTATNEQLEEMFKNAEAVAMQNALIKAQAELYDANAQALINKAKADSAAEEATKARIEAEENWQKNMTETGDTLKDMSNEYYDTYLKASSAEREATKAQQEASEAAEKASEELTTQTSALENLNKEYGLLPDGTSEVVDATSDTAEAIRDVGTAADETSMTLDKYGNDITGMSEEAAAAVTEATSQIIDAYGTMRDGIADAIEGSISFFDEFSGGTEVTSEEIKANLDSQIEGIQNWSENMQTLAGEVGNGMSQEMYDALAEMGPESANLVQTLVDALNSGTGDFEEIAGKWAEAMQLKDQSNVIADYTSVGQELTQNLATSIANGTQVVTEAATSVMDSVREAIGEATEGLGESIVISPDGILQKLGEYRDAGVQLGESAAEGISSTSGEIDEALSPDAGGLTSKAGEYEEAGRTLGVSYASGLSSSVEAAGQSGTQLVQAGAQAIQQQLNSMQTAGQQSAQTFTSALDAGKTQANTSGAGLSSAAKSGVSSKTGEFSSVGRNIASGVAGGIQSGQSIAISAASNMAAAALAAAKARLDIRSPSKKFRAEVGKMIPTGTAFGIKDNTKLATKEADKMSLQVYTKATTWLSNYKKKQKVALNDEKWYWQQVLKHVQKGTTAYDNATAKMIVSGVSRTKTTGSGKRKKTTTKDTETYYSEIYQAAEKYMSKMEALNDVSTKNQLAYWQSMTKQLKKGTTAWYNAQAKIKSIKSKIGTVSNMNSILTAYKTYYDISEKAEMDYWDRIRRQYTQGTEERLEADEKYLDAREKYTDKLKDLEDDYKDKVEDVNKKLKDDIAELTDKYKSDLEDRKKAIKDAFGLFDEFKSESADGKTLLFNIKAQAVGYEDWMQQIEQLSGKGILDQSLIDELTEQGPEISAAIHALNSLSEEELKEYNEAYLKKLELSETQAKKDTEDLKKELEDQTKKLNEQAEKDKADLNKTYNEAVAKVNTNLSASMKNLASQVKTIVDDQTAKLVNAITGEKRKAGAEKTKDPKPASTPTVKKPSSSTSTSATKKTDKVLMIINSGKSRKKLSSSERKKHAALYNYIADHYGKSANNDMYKKLGSELGVKTSKTVTSKQKTAILKALKKKGYRQGGKIKDEYTWMDEELNTKGPEMIVRKADNAILTRTRPGDEIINADTAANLAQIGKYSLEDLKKLVREQGAQSYLQNLHIPAGLEKVNRLMEVGMAQERNRIDTQRMEQLLENTYGLLNECIPYFQRIGQNTQITLDGDTLVSKTAERMGNELAMRQRRYRR